MSGENSIKVSKADIVSYEDVIPIRGCKFNLSQIKSLYRELSTLNRSEGEKVISSLKKPPEISEEDFSSQNEYLLGNAFVLTVSIIGFDGETCYGENENVFDSENIPFNIKTIFFTNVTAFSRNAKGEKPKNHFYIWIHFDKPPLFDPNPLVSDKTPNESNLELHAEDLGYYRAVQNIIGKRIKESRKWYYFIHGNFSYDAGLWIIALPYALYWVTVLADYFIPQNSSNSMFKPAVFIYGMGLSILFYRFLTGYVKWAYPVNILEENNDISKAHRIVLGAIIFSMIVGGVKAVLGYIPGL